ncbi:hypothetical protein CEXT_517501 [Caerostris extrusa]|uniref:Uncharacterized protein n=1 Tax=Caerostris extrusa TaxID=172846 RepID=A0AAV4XR05_CAEEX|nr:hypothetical protein CEXT_517501 [Caerostris extrusa]
MTVAPEPRLPHIMVRFNDGLKEHVAVISNQHKEDVVKDFLVIGSREFCQRRLTGLIEGVVEGISKVYNSGVCVASVVNFADWKRNDFGVASIRDEFVEFSSEFGVFGVIPGSMSCVKIAGNDSIVADA